MLTPTGQHVMLDNADNSGNTEYDPQANTFFFIL